MKLNFSLKSLFFCLIFILNIKMIHAQNLTEENLQDMSTKLILENKNAAINNYQLRFPNLDKKEITEFAKDLEQYYEGRQTAIKLATQMDIAFDTRYAIAIARERDLDTGDIEMLKDFVTGSLKSYEHFSHYKKKYFDYLDFGNV